jgi:TolB protein
MNTNMKSNYKKILSTAFFVITLCYASAGWAILHLVLTQGVDSALPIAIVPFAQPTTAVATDVSAVMTSDLQNSGRFKPMTDFIAEQMPHQASDVQTSGQLAYWQKQGVTYVVVGKVTTVANQQYQVSYSLINVYKGAAQAEPVTTQTFTVPANQLRKLAHVMSDAIYQKILGERGIFSTKIAYIILQRAPKQPPTYKLMVADYDGANAQPILISDQPIMSPAWSPDGQKIAYVSFETGLPGIYLSNIVTGKRQLITKFPGINGAPAFSPDGSQLAVVLSKDKTPNIYVVSLADGSLRAITRNRSINTEPNWNPDGQSLVFTSDQGGSPQIYQVNLGSNAIKRLTFSGNYNAHANFTPDSENLVLQHRGNDTDGKFGIGLFNLASGIVQVLSSNNDQSPSIAPNGSMVIYATENASGVNGLAMVSIDGRTHLNLPSEEGEVREPAWSPFLEQQK